MGENDGVASGPTPGSEVSLHRLEALAGRLRLRSELALVGSVAFAVALAASIPAVTPIVFESILTLLFTAPALVLAVYGVARTQIQRLVRAAEPLDDRFARRSRHLGWTAGILITTALFVGLLALGEVDEAGSVALSTRIQMFVVLFGALFGVYALTDAVILSRQSLTPEVLSDRLVRGFAKAHAAGDADRRRDCGESLMNLSLAAVEDGRAADIGVFVAALGECLALETSPGAGVLGAGTNGSDEDRAESDAASTARWHLLQLAVRVAERLDQFVHVLRALASAPPPESERSTVTEATMGLLGLALRHHPSETEVVAAALALVPGEFPPLLWREPVRSILLTEVPGDVVTAVEGAVLARWQDDRMTDEEFASILDAALQEFSDAPTRAAARRIVGFCERAAAKRRLPEEVARILAERVTDLATRVPGPELQVLLLLLSRHRSIALEALRRLELSPNALARWSLFLRLVRLAGRDGWNPPSAGAVPDESEIPGVLGACIEVLSATDAAAEPEDVAASAKDIRNLMDALAPVGLGLLPLVAHLRIAADAASGRSQDRSDPEAEGEAGGSPATFGGRDLRRFGPDFSAPLPSEALGTVPLGVDLVADALSEIVDALGPDGPEGRDRDRILLSLLVVVILEAARRSGFDPRIAALLDGVLDAADGAEGLLDQLVDDARRSVLSHCREIEHLLLPATVGEDDLSGTVDLIRNGDGASSEWSPRAFMVAMRHGLLALVVAASIRSAVDARGSATPEGSEARREVMERLLRHAMRPGVSVGSVSTHLLEIGGHELREAVVGRRDLSGGNLDGRDALARLLVPDAAHIGRLLEANDARGLCSAAGVISMYLESGPAPGAGSGLKRTKKTLAAAVMLLMAMRRASETPRSGSEGLEGAAADLRAHLTSWLGRALEDRDPETSFTLALMIQNSQPGHLWRELASEHTALNRELAAVLDVSGIGIAPRHSAASRSVDLVLRVNPWLEAATLRSGRTVPGLTTAPRAMATFLRRAGDLPPHDQLRRISQDLASALLRCRSEGRRRARHGVPDEDWEVNVAGSLDARFVDLLLLVFEFIARHSFRLEGRHLAQMERDLDRIAVRPGELAERAGAVRRLVAARTSS